MILLLGKNKTVEKYAEETLKIDMRNDIVYYPESTVHYSDYPKYISIAREEKPPVITSQSLEVIDILLKSDLEFNIITVLEVDGVITVRNVTKEKAIQIKEDYGLELR